MPELWDTMRSPIGFARINLSQQFRIDEEACDVKCNDSMFILDSSKWCQYNVILEIYENIDKFILAKPIGDSMYLSLMIELIVSLNDILITVQ
jgi:hypothetical protein